MKTKVSFFPMLQEAHEAHEAACNAYNILSDIVELCRDDVSVDDDTASSIEELQEVADELQSSLFDLLEAKS